MLTQSPTTARLVTAVFLTRLVDGHEEVLLGMKARGFGAGKWNGFGGKVAPNEHVDDAARRELFEEANCGMSDVRLAGIVFFVFEGSADGAPLEMRIYTAAADGTPSPSEEMTPIQWFRYDAIPYDSMWRDSAHWLPSILSRRFTLASYRYASLDSFTPLPLVTLPSSFPLTSSPSSTPDGAAAVSPSSSPTPISVDTTSTPPPAATSRAAYLRDYIAPQLAAIRDAAAAVTHDASTDAAALVTKSFAKAVGVVW